MENQDKFLYEQESIENEYQSEKISQWNSEKEYRRNVRHVCNVLGWSLTFFTVMTVAAAVILSLAGNYRPDGNVIETLLNKIVNSSWYSTGGNTLIVYALVLPFMFLILRLVPEKQASKTEITFRQFLKFLILAQGLGTIFNFFGNTINNAVAAGNGGDTWKMDPVNKMLESISPMLLLYAGFLGPVIEEYIFRHKLLNRLRVFGDKAAIIYTALMFGFMHGNVTQFLYASAIGMILGYVAIRTGQMRYNCLLHILINCWSLVMALLVTCEGLLPLVITYIMIALTGLSVIGTVIYTILNIRKLKLSDERLSDGAEFRGTGLSMYVNPGTLAFIFVSLVEMAFFLTR